MESSSASPPRERRASLRMLSDRPIGEPARDLLGAGDHAEALAGLIHNPETATPLTLAIHAPWGSGKSSVAELVKAKLREKASVSEHGPHVVCEFNAWMHDDAQHLESAFVAAVARSADAARPRLRRLIRPLPARLLTAEGRLRRRLTLAGLGALLVFLLVGILAELPWLLAPLGITLGPLAQAGALSVLLAAAAKGVEVLQRARSAVASFVADPEAQAAGGRLGEVRAQLGRLIAQATGDGRRFVVFIDDVERVRPPRSVDVLETANQLLDHPNVVVVILGDTTTVAACAEIKYADVARKEGGPAGAYGRRYLQKLIQVQFDLPPVPRERVEAMTRTLLTQQEAKPPIPTAAMVAREALAPLRAPLRWAWDAHEGPLQTPLRPLRHRRGLVAAAAALLWMACLPFRWAMLRASRRAASPAQRWGRHPPRFGRLAEGLGTACGVLVTGTVALLGLGALSVVATVYFVAGLDTPDYARLRALADWAATLDFGYFALGLLYVSLYLVGLPAAAFSMGLRRFARAEAEYREAILRVMEDDLRELPAPPPHLQPARADAIVRQVRERYLARDSPILREAAGPILRHHPGLPRNAKRMVNRLRLLLAVADLRRLFDATPAVLPAHVGKWVVLQERWPELAARVGERPALLATLETADEATRRAALRGVQPHLGEDRALLALLADEPPLKDVVASLVHLSPVAPASERSVSVAVRGADEPEAPRPRPAHE